MNTVLMATRNGAGWIARTLQSMTHLIPPEQGWRLIVVDSASTDGTMDVVDGFAGRLPLATLRCARPGKNAALNLALTHVEQGLVIMTDDDVLVAPDWLQRMERAAATASGFAVFGGAIRPVWPRPPEPWLLRLAPLGLTFGVTPAMPSGECRPLDVWGPNMAIRREVFGQGIRFDETIGPDGSATYAMGSETSLVQRLAARGRRCFHVADAVVGHLIRDDQMTREFVLRRAYRGGRGNGRMAAEFDPAATLGQVPRYYYRQAGGAALRYAASVLASDDAESFRAAWAWRHALGAIRGARDTAALAPSQPPRERFDGVALPA